MSKLYACPGRFVWVGRAADLSFNLRRLGIKYQTVLELTRERSKL